MVDLLELKSLVVQSHRGPYEVLFRDSKDLILDLSSKVHFIVDSKVAYLYAKDFESLSSLSVLKIDATETHKSLEKMKGYIEHLISKGLKRGHVLIAIGGGIIQDIVCFLSTILFRGLDWYFYPTTLLAQADSCIGSKSSVNVGEIKNVVGTFTPPKKIFVQLKFLNSLKNVDLRSGVGEMLKVHAIEGPEAFDQISKDYSLLFSDRQALIHYIYRSLEIKKRIIEIDEFDHGLRNIMNYGHSFGHALESATDFAIPHGIAVSMGMDMANFIAMNLGLTSEGHFQRMHSVLKRNYMDFVSQNIPLETFLKAISRDKKNVDGALTLILPDLTGRVSRMQVSNDGNFHNFCRQYFIDMKKV